MAMLVYQRACSHAQFPTLQARQRSAPLVHETARAFGRVWLCSTSRWQLYQFLVMLVRQKDRLESYSKGISYWKHCFRWGAAQISSKFYDSQEWTEFWVGSSHPRFWGAGRLHTHTDTHTLSCWCLWMIMDVICSKTSPKWKLCIDSSSTTIPCHRHHRSFYQYVNHPKLGSTIGYIPLVSPGSVLRY